MAKVFRQGGIWLLILMVPLEAAAALPRPAAGPPPRLPAPGFLYFEILKDWRDARGLASREFALGCTDPGATAAQMFYRELSGETLFSVPLADGTFTLSSERTARFRLFAVARGADGAVLTACTDTVLFGRAKIPVARTAAGQNAVSALPFIRLVQPGAFFWIQTGQAYSFTRPEGGREAALNVLQSGRIYPLAKIDPPARTSPAAFRYVPPHDERLRKAGYYARRQDILFTEVSGDPAGRATYTLAVHRARFAYDCHGAGWLVAGFSFAFFTGLVALKRRTPWWKD